MRKFFFSEKAKKFEQGKGVSHYSFHLLLTSASHTTVHLFMSISSSWSSEEEKDSLLKNFFSTHRVKSVVPESEKEILEQRIFEQQEEIELERIRAEELAGDYNRAAIHVVSLTRDLREKNASLDVWKDMWMEKAEAVENLLYKISDLERHNAKLKSDHEHNIGKRDARILELEAELEKLKAQNLPSKEIELEPETPGPTKKRRRKKVSMKKESFDTHTPPSHNKRSAPPGLDDEKAFVMNLYRTSKVLKN